MINRYNAVRQRTVQICQPLLLEDYIVQPIEDVSPPKWHLAHTTWFFEEFFLAKYLKGYKRFHPQYAYLFNSYYDAVGSRIQRVDRGNMSRPILEDIQSYRRYVDEHMQQLIPALNAQNLSLLAIGLHHEEQHQELLFTDIKYILGHNPLFPTYHKDFLETTQPADNEKGFVEMPADSYEIGHKGDNFAFDNEKKAHRVFLDDFQIQRNLVSNIDYLSFVEEEGYARSCYWHSDAWTWIHENSISCPLYWHKIDGRWYQYTMAGLVPLEDDGMVTHLTYYEAAAFAEWSNMRLPTEFEWEASCSKFTWGQRWEHTNSAYLPYPGFKKPKGAIGEYNGKFMINQMVLRGGSVVTAPGHTRKTYRNFFHPRLGWQFTGVRLCNPQS